MGKVIWFTGLSGSGKTTIALELKNRLEFLGKNIEILDGDVIRSTLNKHLGFSRADIRENNKLIAELANKKLEEYDFILVPIISPYLEDRQMARSILKHDFIELFLNTSLEVCIKRDVKGLYKKALSGEIDNFIGVSDSNPYQPPTNPDIDVRTDRLDLDQSISQIMVFFKNRNLL